jgi:hypothetical protein
LISCDACSWSSATAVSMLAGQNGHDAL